MAFADKSYMKWWVSGWERKRHGAKSGLELQSDDAALCTLLADAVAILSVEWVEEGRRDQEVGAQGEGGSAVFSSLFDSRIMFRPPLLLVVAIRPRPRDPNSLPLLATAVVPPTRCMAAVVRTGPGVHLHLDEEESAADGSIYTTTLLYALYTD